MEMKLFAIIFLVTAVCTCSVTANCPNDQKGSAMKNIASLMHGSLA